MKKSLLFGIILTACVVIVAFVFVQAYPLGLVSLWKFDEGQGTIASDSIDTNPGTIYGATWTTGIVGNALSFDGVDDYVKVSNSSNLEPSNITVDAWVKSSNPGNAGGARYILAKGARACERASYALWARGSSGGIEFYISDGYYPGRFSPAAPQAAVWDGNWHHVAGTYDGNKIRLYLDGVEIGDGTPETIQIGYGTVMTTTNDLSIGRYDGTCKISYTGLIDEVEIFNRALPQSEIQAIYDAGKVIDVEIDIKPGSDPNSINLSSVGVISVAILSSDTFDATEVDPATVFLAGADVKMAGKSGKYLSHIEDVNGDQLMDLVCQVYTAQFMVEPGDAVAELTAKTHDGQPIRGEDSIRIVKYN